MDFLNDWIDDINAKIKGWRTLIANILMSVMPLLELAEIIAVLPDNWLPWYALSVAVMNIWLRSVTNSPMGQRY